MPKFKILNGRHSEGTHKNSEGKVVSTIYQRGDIVDSKSDLVAKFNSPGAEKFELVHEATTANTPDANIPNQGGGKHRSKH